MDWIIVFVISWIIFGLTLNKSKVIKSLYVGIIAAISQTTLDFFAVRYKVYLINNIIFDFFNSSIFFTFGPVFVISALIYQYYPSRRIMKLINIIILTVLYSAQEILLVLRGDVVYIKWNFIYSLFVNVAAISLYSLIAERIIKKGKIL